jgi:tight adherence protein B
MPVAFDDVATLVERLAVLTGAGIAPLSAWRHAAAEGALAEAQRVVAGLDSAHGLPDRLVEVANSASEGERTAWAALAATWWIATEAGAALSATLTRSAEVLRGLAQGAREVEVALAGPTATSRVVLALPAVGLALGGLLGFDVIGALVTVPGAICLVAGGILIAVAVRWNRRLIRVARDLDATPGLAFELFAVALAGGASIERARVLVGSAYEETGLDPPDGEVDAVLAFARDAGVPAVVLLRSEADGRRRTARTIAATRAAELETRLLLPLGLCVLPAFVLLGVLPIALSIISATVVDA